MNVKHVLLFFLCIPCKHVTPNMEANKRHELVKIFPISSCTYVLVRGNLMKRKL